MRIEGEHRFSLPRAEVWALLLDPDVIVLGGGLSNISELYRELPQATEAYLFDGVRAPPVLPPKFGATSGIRGAAILALEGEHSRG